MITITKGEKISAAISIKTSALLNELLRTLPTRSCVELTLDESNNKSVQALKFLFNEL